MTDRDPDRAVNHMLMMLRVGPSSVVIQATILWIDTWREFSQPSHARYYVPDTLPPEVADSMNEADMWALRLTTARLNNEPEAFRALLASACEDRDTMLDGLAHLLTIVAMRIRQPLNSGIPHRAD
ncbi:hypothetical protein ACFXPR_18105 [Nocardia tengchongensis]|uniref:hypothetical protein n=1 Tax=Nocardia tengchongensis TaxID=2055889 RepID=UPI0036842B6D